MLHNSRLEDYQKAWGSLSPNLTLKASVTIAADDNFYFFFFQKKKTSLDISCESSAWQMIHMKWQDLFSLKKRGWSGVAMVLCILRHRGVQLKLAYSWARPAILVAGKGRGGMFLFLLFLHFHSCSYFFPNRLCHLLYYLFYLFSPFLWETTQNDPQGLTCR